MIYNSVNDVKKMMIDITTNCQALCPGCQRTRGGTKEHPVNPTLTTGQNDWPLGGNMSFDIFKKALKNDLNYLWILKNVLKTAYFFSRFARKKLK